jgi:N utilization substance protein A
MNEEDAATKGEQEARRSVQAFMDQLGVDENLAAILVEEGFSTVDEVAYVPLAEMQAIDELDDETIDLLRERAKDVLLTRAIATEEDGARDPAQDLLEMEGMDESLAYTLAARGVATVEDLADQSVDDLMDIDGMDPERAASLIMKAREPWFAEAQQD